MTVGLGYQKKPKKNQKPFLCLSQVSSSIMVSCLSVDQKFRSSKLTEVFFVVNSLNYMNFLIKDCLHIAFLDRYLARFLLHFSLRFWLLQDQMEV